MKKTIDNLGFKRIATEEAFATQELFKAYRDLLARKGSEDIGFNSLKPFMDRGLGGAVFG